MADTTNTPKPVIDFSRFLESTHPGVSIEVGGLWQHERNSVPQVLHPDLRLHCTSEQCSGIRTFRSRTPRQSFSSDEREKLLFIDYICSDCRQITKKFSLHLSRSSEIGFGYAYKFGELPKFGTPVSNQLLRLFGADRPLFLKGRQCENQGLGVAAFAYYRRVVENHRTEIIDGIISVCTTINAPAPMIETLERAKKEISFAKGIEVIKDGIPDALLISGHNPLSLLHRALSIGLHNETDAACLDAAHDIRLVLAELVERMASLKKNDADLSAAVHRLLKK